MFTFFDARQFAPWRPPDRLADRSDAELAARAAAIERVLQEPGLPHGEVLALLVERATVRELVANRAGRAATG